MSDPIEIMARATCRANGCDQCVDDSQCFDWRTYAANTSPAVIRALDASGWCIVPSHATPEISHAGDEQAKTYDDPVSLYETMVEAGRIRVPS